jgi:hypothetical protein
VGSTATSVINRQYFHIWHVIDKQTYSPNVPIFLPAKREYTLVHFLTYDSTSMVKLRENHYFQPLISDYIFVPVKLKHVALRCKLFYDINRKVPSSSVVLDITSKHVLCDFTNIFIVHFWFTANWNTWLRIKETLLTEMSILLKYSKLKGNITLHVNNGKKNWGAGFKPQKSLILRSLATVAWRRLTNKGTTFWFW